MASDDQINPNSPSSSSSNLSSSNPDHWKQRVLIPTVFAGIAGGDVGSVLKHRKVHGLSPISATYASNFAASTGSIRLCPASAVRLGLIPFLGAHEFVRVSREGKSYDLRNSIFGGIGSGAILGCLQAGPVGAARYYVMFAIVETEVDYAYHK